MTLTHTLGGSPLPLPRADDPFGMEYIPFGAAERKLNCNYHMQLLGARWRVRESWEGLTKVERDSLFGLYAAYLAAPAAYVMPDGLTLTVYTGLNTWSESHYYQPHTGVVYYNVSFQLEQA